MDNFETESNYSYHSDSLQSNTSSLSGLSLYGNEFAELRHLVNPTKYPQSYLERSSTPKAELTCTEDDKLADLKNDLHQSLELNEQYKLELHNLERKIELRCSNKIDKLLKSNSRLEGELENANNQIERLLKSYKEKHDYLVFKEKYDLEKKIYQLNTDYSELQKQGAKINQEKCETDLENKNLKISLDELLTERDVKNSSIQCLKQKVSEQHIEIQTFLQNNNHLNENLNLLSTKFVESEKSKVWYRDQLTVYQDDKKKLNDELMKYRNQISNFNDKISCLNINLSKYKNEVDNVRLQALKEKKELFKKLENINLDSSILKNVPANGNDTPKSILNDTYKYDIQYYEHTVEDLQEEISRIKSSMLDRDREFEKLNQENSTAISKCLILQKTLEQKEVNIEFLESSKRELVKKLEYLVENEKEKLCGTLQLKNKVTQLEIELKRRNEEKQDVEKSIQLIREQFLKFKKNYEKVKCELNSKNKEILQLHKDKQELFMSNNWTVCELEKIKQKYIIIDNLKKENENLVTNIETLMQKIRVAEFQNLKSDKIIEEKDNIILGHVNELANYNNVIVQYKALTSDHEDKISVLEHELREISNKFLELEDDFDKARADLKGKDLKLTETLNTIEHQQHEYKKSLEEISSEKNMLLASYKTLQESYSSEIENKDKCICELKNKLGKLENDWQSYLKRITDDQKVELLLSNQKSFSTIGFTADSSSDRKQSFTKKNIEGYVINFFENLNIEEFEGSVVIRLKYLDERIRKIKGISEQLEQKLDNQSGKNKIKDLEILLQVKDREMKDKQKKMDRNNSTLLRKVKEHMKGRNAAEKQLKYLNDLYKSLADDNNTSKLSLYSKECEVKCLQEFSEGHKREIEKLRSTVKTLEQVVSKARICEKCLEIGHLKEKLVYFEILCKEVQERNISLEEQLKCNKETFGSLYEKNKEQEIENNFLQQHISNIQVENGKYKDSLTKLQDVEKIDVSQRDLITKLKNQVLEKDDLYKKNTEVIEKFNQDLTDAREKIEFLLSEKQINSSNFQQKVEYSEELEQKVTNLEEQYLQQNTKHQKIIIDYNKKVLLLQNDINMLKNDKFFLQRLSNDLKVSLNSYVDHNKKLQEQLKLFTTEKQAFKSLPPNLLDDVSISGKYNDKYIAQLLQKNRDPSARKPVTAEIQSCLSKLREEIFSLQDQISRKNGIAHVD